MSRFLLSKIQSGISKSHICKIVFQICPHIFSAFNIISVSYDKFNATQWAINATEQGLPLEEYSQTLGNFNRPTKELERLILSGKAVIDNNDITRNCFRNVVLKSDYCGNVKPVKSQDKKKIDGVIAMIQALGGYLLTPHYTNTIFTI